MSLELPVATYSGYKMHSEDLTPRVYSLFQKSVEAKMQVGEELAPQIALAAHIIVQALLDNKKVLICGNGNSAALAQVFASSLVDRFERERPGLPAIWLGGNVSCCTAITSDSGIEEVYAKQVRALGQENDILCVISTDGNSNNLISAIHAARDRDMSVIAFTGQGGGKIIEIQQEDDVHICANINSRARINEVHLLSLFCVCDLIDSHLFG